MRGGRMRGGRMGGWEERWRGRGRDGREVKRTIPTESFLLCQIIEANYDIQ